MADYTSYVGIETSGIQYHQLPVGRLIETALWHQEGLLAENGALIVDTSPYTGRLPQARFIVDTPDIHDQISWGKVNKPTTTEVFDRVFEEVREHLASRNLYIFDGLCGADPRYAMQVRFINELASQNLFVHQLFVRPNKQQLQNFEPEFTVIAAPTLKLDPEDGTGMDAAILLNMERKIVLVVGTRYSGEMKKSIFSVMNYLMPERNVLPMHCSSNVGLDGKSALFFGLSGTGKTTLSADPDRILIGDDEHGWSDAGVFNFEGGCYAKTIKLSRENEPEIWDAIRFGALGENIIIDPDTRRLNYDDNAITENTRVGYPVEFIPNVDPDGMAPHPSAVIFLTADAFGVLPPIARLTEEQAQYHFISGYTSKVAGTEQGITEPVAVFSTCFGEPFMPRPASVYAKMLHERLLAHKSSVYLINTGWQGGPYGVGERISIPHTRAMVTAALSGELDKANFVPHPVFKVMMPTSCPGVPAEILNPRNTWADKAAYDEQARKLAQMFINNFKTFENVQHLEAAGPSLQGSNISAPVLI